MPTAATCIARTACLLIGGLVGGAYPVLAAPPSPSPAGTAASDLDPEALAALDRMGAALRSLKYFTLTSEGSTELVLDNDQKIELDGMVTYKVQAPDKLFLELNSDRQLRQLFYDGNALTVYSPRLKYYAQVDGVGATLGELVDRASTRYGIELPLADMFLWGTDKAPTSNIRNALHIGGGTIDGEAVEQYAFKQDAVDWQVWISRETSLPKKLVINALDDPTQPQYRARLHWDTRTPVPATAFQFTAPADAARIKLVSAAVAAPDAGQEN
ncbi:DUF2092 domain-containing protein [uncultured Stenotrophomonas sp.]|uniref:DUF2092 domain-containing protein n=1 Tax=uncultured Stenotrophomonas sp. TaxID=165438 RepID=UPI0028E21E65|nr:DUF2092 domain-containing protein [uncultured Stenotrophomonas sp.]